MLAKVGQNEEKVRFFSSRKASEKNLTFGGNFWSRPTTILPYSMETTSTIQYYDDSFDNSRSFSFLGYVTAVWYSCSTIVLL